MAFSTASRKAFLSTVMTLLPFFLNSSTRRASEAMISRPVFSAASSITSPKIFFSSADSLPHSWPDTTVSSESTMWPVSEMFFCTSKNFFASMVGSGFSCASTVPFCSARYTSAKAIGVALAPSAFGKAR